MISFVKSGDQMNDMPILKGVYDESFLGESQYETATNIVTDASNFFDKVEHIRKTSETSFRIIMLMVTPP
jgi:hypothetical protein